MTKGGKPAEDHQVKEILDFIAELRSGNLEARRTPSGLNDSLDRIITGLNGLAEEFSIRSVSLTGTEQWIEEISEVIIGIASLDFTRKAPVSEKGNAFDAVAAGLNALSEELFASTVSKEYFDCILQSMMDMLVVIAPGTTIQKINPAVTENLGYTEEELIDKPVKLLFAEEAFNDAGIDELLETGVARSVETAYRTRDGNKLPVSFSSSVLTDRNGQIRGAVCVARDITARKRMEEELKRSYDLFSSFMDHLPGVAYMKDRQGRYIYVNEVGLRLSGKKLEDIIGKTDDELWPAEVAEQLKANDQLVLDEGKTIDTVEEVPVDDGSTHHWLATKFPLLDTDGKPEILAGTSIDISERLKAEQELQHERELKSKYLDIADVIIVELSPTGEIVLINEMGSEILGYRKEEITGKNWFTTFLPERVRSRVRAVHRENVSEVSNVADRFENPVVTSDGSERIIAWHNTVLVDDSGKITGTLSSGKDITEYRRVEEELKEYQQHLEELVEQRTSKLRESEQDYRELVEKLSEGLVVVDSDGTTVFANARAIKMIGYSLEEMTGRNWSCFVPPVEHGKIEEKRKRRPAGFSDSFESSLLTKTGSLVPVVVSAAPLFMPDGTYRGVLVLFTDITRLKKIETALQASETKFKNITELSREIILRVAVDGTCTYINRAGSAFFGLAVEELTGADVSRFVHPDSIEKTEQVFATIIRTGELVEGFTCNMTVNGVVRIIEWNISPIRDDSGNVVEFQASGRDVTELQEDIIEKNKLAAVGQLAAGVAHELNTPLANIDLAVEYLLNLSANDPSAIDTGLLRSELHDIKEESTFCARVVRDLLHFSRKIELITKTLAVKPLISEIMENPSVQSRVVEKNINVTLDIDGNTKLTGDRSLLFQVFLNIIKNAIDAIDDRTDRPLIKIAAVRENRAVLITVTDNGVGIRKEDLDRVFEPFFSTKKMGEGTGLGLSICKNIVEKHGGNISITSTAGTGTEVTVVIPVNNTED
ncbi:MAG: PAS domain S-box protein [Candidatus Odinarchaeota archaeon]